MLGVSEMNSVIVTKMKPKKSQTPLRLSYSIVVDNREKLPYTFDGMKGPSPHRQKIIVDSFRGHLETGDYAITSQISGPLSIRIERKTLVDLFATLGSHRERFEREHERLAEFKRAVIIIEADWRTIINDPPERSRLNPNSVFGTSTSWFVKYGVPWIACPGRRFAELYTFKLFQQFWKNHIHKENDHAKS